MEIRIADAFPFIVHQKHNWWSEFNLQKFEPKTEVSSLANSSLSPFYIFNLEKFVILISNIKNSLLKVLSFKWELCINFKLVKSTWLSMYMDRVESCVLKCFTWHSYRRNIYFILPRIHFVIIMIVESFWSVKSKPNYSIRMDLNMKVKFIFSHDVMYV